MCKRPWRRHCVEREMEIIRATPNLAEDSRLVVTMVHNAEHYLPAFIEHHQGLGFDHILVIDNGSVDSTMNIAQSYDGVSLYRCVLPFREHQVAAREWALDNFGRNCWCLVADCDEHFDWPFRGTLPLDALIEHLESEGSNALIAQMIDACGESGSGSVHACPDLQTFRSLYPNLYLSGYQWRPYHFNMWFHRNELARPDIHGLMGGLRRDLFGVLDFATKTPFFHYSGSVKPLVLNSHAIFGAKIAGFTAILRHYKVVSGYAERLEQFVRKGYDQQSMRNYRASQQRFEEGSMANLDILLRLHAQPVEEVAELEPLGLVEIDEPLRTRVRQVSMLQNSIVQPAETVVAGQSVDGCLSC